ncbi:MAG: efflux RND transporter permease subunit [Oscillospiraceae bacterium]|nr:efflux RND transporter permease subunit [Oscillospiraceae bacterium]
MIKTSVKKPFTVLVAVIMVLVLGVVSLTSMTTDLLPPMSLPYLIVVTTYPGASPEKVEADVVRPMESALGTVSGVSNVYSTSAENYGMVQLEFEDGTDMDSTLVKVNTALQGISASLPELCSTPSIIELSMDMMATMYVSVSREGNDIFELSNFVTNTVQPYLERQNGVASVSGIGLVEQSIHVSLDQKKIDDLNAKILQTVNDGLAAAATQLDAAEQQVKDGKAELEKAQASFGSTMAGTLFGQIEGKVLTTASDLKVKVDDLLQKVKDLRSEITDGQIGQLLDSLIAELETVSKLLESESLSVEELMQVAGSLRVIVSNTRDLLKLLDTELENGENASITEVRQQLDDIASSLSDISTTLDSVPQILAGLENAYATLTQAQLDAAVAFATASTQLAGAEAQLIEARAQYEAAKESALSGANLGQLLSVGTLSQLIYAQNFSMPAGYIDDAKDNSWLLKIGNEYETLEDLSNALLVKMDAIGEVRLCDVATVTILDNADLSYARFNGEQAVVLSIYKNSVTGTNETANNCLEAFKELEEKYPGTKLATLMNQGSYIEIIIDSVLSSMITGAILAIVILALFLKDVKPTLVVAVSIPLSVMFTLVLMYFTGISLNMMTLCGLALGIGMLVDNSIVVIENIYRLRNRGVNAPRAAVQGTKQVAGSIISSTLTTVAVFFPLVFTTGMIKELLLPLGICIGFCLMASLIVALTVVPASASTLLKNSKAKKHPWFDKFQEGYGKFLNWCLDHKAVPLSTSILLLAICIIVVLNMGIVLLPEMTGNQISVTVTTPEGLTREESYAMADDVIDILLGVDGVDEVGVIDSSASAGMMGGMSLGSGNSYGSYSYYIILPEGTPTTRVNEITDDISDAIAELPCEVSVSAGGMGDMVALLGSGLSVNISGSDLETMKQIATEVAEIVKQVDGYEEITTSFAVSDQTIHLVIDKDKAMANGLTVAQIYMEISGRMTTSATSTKVTLNGTTMSVTVENSNNPLTVENLLDMTLTASTMDANGQQVTKTIKLSDVATIEETSSIGSISRENQTRYVTVSAGIAEGFNATLLSRELSTLLDEYKASGAVPHGFNIELSGESSTVNDMVLQMGLLIALGCLFIYLIMVAQFQSLLSPFIVLFTVPLAFTGGMFGLIITGEQLSLLALMGFALLMGTVVNNGIVFVDYVNQLRIGGMDRRSALIATGKTRMRPIMMTALTTILAMFQLIFSDDMAGQMGRGMSIVVVGGMIYATAMTLIIVPVIYDILFKRNPRNVDIGSDDMDDVPDDAAEFIAEALALEAAKAAEAAITEAPIETTAE